MKKIRAAGLTAFLLAAASGSGYAHMPSDPEAVGNLSTLSDAANVIVRGKVVAVKYRNSAGGRNGSRGVPYTFVTYAVSSVLQGANPGKTLTLRFVGGADGRGSFVDAEGVPHFQVGEEDILFVVGNGERGCPLVMCEFGRFRILNDTMYEAHGAPVVSVGNGRVRAEGRTQEAFQTFSYPAPEFDELMKRPEFSDALQRSRMSIDTARARYEAEVPKVVELQLEEIEARPDLDRATAAAPVAVESFVAAIQSAAAGSAMRPRQVVRSIDASAAIVAPSAVASAPPALPPGPVQRQSPGPIIRKN
jgi:hypothetical protein